MLGSSPQCAQAVVIWQHGRYTILPNNSISLDPSMFAADGRVQVQNPCSAKTKLLTYYQQRELFTGWEMAIDLNRAAYSMQLLRFDGSLFPRFVLWRCSVVLIGRHCPRHDVLMIRGRTGSTWLHDLPPCYLPLI